jgi:hypothetical protein
MVEDKYCPLNLEGMCFEMVAHGFSEEQEREKGRMKPCNMGKHNGYDITHFHYCITYKSFQNACQTPGIISPRCYEAIQDAKYHGIIDGKIIDLKSKELLVTISQD